MKFRFLISLFALVLLNEVLAYPALAQSTADNTKISEDKNSDTGKKQINRKDFVSKTKSLLKQREHTKMTDSAAKSTPFPSFVSLKDDDEDSARAKDLFSQAIRLQHEDRLAEAIDAYKSVLNIRPDSYEVFYNLAICLREKGSPDLAAKAFEQAAKLHPYFKPVYKDLASVYAQLGRNSDAESALATYGQL